MTAWTSTEVQNHFTELLQACATEPQLLQDHDESVAVVLDIKMFRAVTAASKTIREVMATNPEMLDLKKEIFENLKIFDLNDWEAEIKAKKVIPQKSMAELMEELEVAVQAEPEPLDIPPRRDRHNPLLDDDFE